MFRREIKIDVWKYIRPILMVLGAVLEKKLDNQDRALHPAKVGLQETHCSLTQSWWG